MAQKILFILLIFGSQLLTTRSQCEVTMEKTEALEQMTFAGGCFWCMEPPFEKLDGVRSVISGYMGGHKEMPTYKEVSSGVTGHAEVVQVTFDPKKVSLEKLLDVFWKNIDPTDANGQFVDRGEQYRSIIFYHDERQKQAAEESKRHLEAAGIFPKEIVTEIKNAGPFYPAEEYHQDYYKVNPIRYKYYRYRSGRDQFLDRVWGKRRDRKIPGMVGVQSVSLISGQADSPAAKSEGRGGLTDDHSMEKSQKFQSGVRPTKEELRKRLSPMQFRVTQEEGTEPAFKNEYWDNKRDGIYVDIVSGEPLFSSTHKYDSKTGWPSFYQPLDKQNIEEHDDSKLWMTRTEARSKAGQSHLGHVFDDGPAPTGKRYCINSAALRFIPKENLEKEGYGDYLKLFKK